MMYGWTIYRCVCVCPELLMSYCPLVERLGLDENFMDVTELVENRRRNMDVSELSFVGHIYRHDGEEITQTHTSIVTCT